MGVARVPFLLRASDGKQVGRMEPEPQHSVHESFAAENQPDRKSAHRHGKVAGLQR